jgi:hypothetical protein
MGQRAWGRGHRAQGIGKLEVGRLGSLEAYGRKLVKQKLRR